MAEAEKTLAPTPASQYPVRKACVVKLPSGAAAELRRPSLFMLTRRGLLPPDVREIVDKLSDRKRSTELTEAEQLTLFDFLIAQSYRDPVCLFRPTDPIPEGLTEDDVICIEDVSDEDRFAIIRELGLKRMV